MPEFDKYAPYVWWCYAIAGTILVGLTAWTFLRAKAAKKKLDLIEMENKSEDKA